MSAAEGVPVLDGRIGQGAVVAGVIDDGRQSGLGIYRSLCGVVVGVSRLNGQRIVIPYSYIIVSGVGNVLTATVVDGSVFRVIISAARICHRTLAVFVRDACVAEYQGVVGRKFVREVAGAEAGAIVVAAKFGACRRGLTLDGIDAARLVGQTECLGLRRTGMVVGTIISVAHDVEGHTAVIKSPVDLRLAGIGPKVFVQTCADISAVIILAHYEIDDVGLAAEARVRRRLQVLDAQHVRGAHHLEFVLSRRYIIDKYGDSLPADGLDGRRPERHAYLRDVHTREQVGGALRGVALALGGYVHGFFGAGVLHGRLDGHGIKCLVFCRVCLDAVSHDSGAVSILYTVAIHGSLRYYRARRCRHSHRHSRYYHNFKSLHFSIPPGFKLFLFTKILSKLFSKATPCGTAFSEPSLQKTYQSRKRNKKNIKKG